MIGISDGERRQAFSVWLRTGRLPTVRADGVELKFNPYHDPRNGQFTFAPGGPRSLDRVVISHRRAPYSAVGSDQNPKRSSPGRTTRQVRDVIDRLADDFVTLEQAIPTLTEAAGGATFAIPEKVFERGQKAVDAAARQADRIMAHVSEFVPAPILERIDPRPLIKDKRDRLRDVRLIRAAASIRFRNDVGPMQVEMMRLMQDVADEAYEKGDRLIKSGRIKVRISRQLTLGNYVDAQVRLKLRERFLQLEIDTAGKGPVRINRQEIETSGDERSYWRPDTRVANVAYDVTLAEKSLKTPQVRGFFQADFKPDMVVIIRPRQLGPNSSYVILRPEVKQ